MRLLEQLAASESAASEIPSVALTLSTIPNLLVTTSFLPTLRLWPYPNHPGLMTPPLSIFPQKWSECEVGQCWPGSVICECTPAHNSPLPCCSSDGNAWISSQQKPTRLQSTPEHSRAKEHKELSYAIRSPHEHVIRYHKHFWMHISYSRVHRSTIQLLFFALRFTQ